MFLPGIPYREHARLLGTDDIDAYIEYGGTLRAGETDFDDPELQSEDISFRDNESTRCYIDTAICQNIQHSLKCFEDGTHFMKLRKLYEANELTNAINRITCSCSQHILPEMFREIVMDAAKDARVTLRQAEFRTQGKDHPILPASPETQYLKCGIYQILE